MGVTMHIIAIKHVPPSAFCRCRYKHNCHLLIVRMIHVFCLDVIHKIFQAHLGASYPSMLRLSWLVKLYENLTYVCMQPAAIALNYSIKDIRHNV